MRVTPTGIFAPAICNELQIHDTSDRPARRPAQSPGPINRTPSGTPTQPSYSHHSTLSLELSSRAPSMSSRAKPRDPRRPPTTITLSRATRAYLNLVLPAKCRLTGPRSGTHGGDGRGAGQALPRQLVRALGCGRPIVGSGRGYHLHPIRLPRLRSGAYSAHRLAGLPLSSYRTPIRYPRWGAGRARRLAYRSPAIARSRGRTSSPIIRIVSG